MTVVKITVLETSLKKDLADEYAVPNLEPCPVLKAGQVFYATNTCPKGMCDAAWRTINQYVFALACGVREFYGGGWMKEPGKVITSPAATTACVRCISNWRPPTNRRGRFSAGTKGGRGMAACGARCWRGRSDGATQGEVVFARHDQTELG